nr:retrovirus-related Pol polyprotein from transposon TNT 1-94 [Tanacetum cinerariifolium]
DSSVALTAFADADHAAKILAGVHLVVCNFWERGLLADYGLAFNKIPMYCDNKSAIALCCNNVQHSRSKHIDIRYHFIKEQVKNGVIELYFVNTEYQLADLFTKALGMDRIDFLTNKLGMRSFTPETLKKLMNEEDEIMATTIEQHVALDEALVPSAQRLRIGRSNFRLPSDIQSKEPTLQVVYDVLRQSPFFKAFLVTADVPEIYMQEFWATATVHQHSIRFKMDTRKHIVDLEAFREMLHISPRIPGQSFAELPFKEEILELFRFLGHSAQIKTLTDVNVNKLYQPWRSFVAVINKCLTGKSTGFDSLRLSQAQILWGLYHRRNIDFAFLIWEDLVYQVEHKNQKKRNEMDDILFSTIKVVSRHQNTQQYGAILPVELTTEDIRNTKAYKEYHACATRQAAPKPKASARKKKGGSASSTTPSTPIATPTPTTTVVATPRLSAAAKGKQPARARSPTKPSDVEPTKAEQLKIVLRRSRHEMHISQQGGSGTDEGTDVDEQTKGIDESEGEKTEESDDDDDDQDEAKNVNDDDDDDEEEISKIGEQEATESDEGDDEATKSDRESEDEETREQKDESFDLIPRTPKDSKDDDNNEEDQGLRIGMESIFTTGSLPENDEFLKTIDDNMKKIIKEQVKNQVKAQVTRILPRIEECVNAQLEAEVLTRSSHSLRTLYAVAADLSEMKLKKILIDKMEGNKSIQRSDEQRNLYKALVEAYDADKTILDTYGESSILKRRREDDDQEGPSAGSDRGSKRRRKGGEHASASTPTEPATESAGRSTIRTQSRQMSVSEEDPPIVQTSQHPEWFSQPRRQPT